MRYFGLCLLFVLAFSFTACSSFPSGASNDYHVYSSSAHLPKRIQVYSTIENKVLWSKDVPIGKKLIMKFNTQHPYDGKLVTGTEPTELLWEIVDYGKHNIHPEHVHELPGHPVMIKMIIIDKEEMTASTQPATQPGK